MKLDRVMYDVIDIEGIGVRYIYCEKRGVEVTGVTKVRRNKWRWESNFLEFFYTGSWMSSAH